jgi:hypothetical protein
LFGQYRCGKRLSNARVPEAPVPGELWHYQSAEWDKVLDATQAIVDETGQAKLCGRFQGTVPNDPAAHRRNYSLV